MTLLVFEHELRVIGARETAALFRELGSATVSVKGWRARDGAAIDCLIAAMVPRDDDTVHFERATLDDAAYAALAAVVDAKPGYVDISDSRWTNLRIWPDRAWVHPPNDGSPRTTAEFPGGGASSHAAIAMFRATAPRDAKGYVMHVTEAAKRALPALLRALRGDVTANLELEPEAAAELAEHVPGELEWQDDGMIVRLPAGTITAYRTRATESDVPKWRARVAKALAKARSKPRP